MIAAPAFSDYDSFLSSAVSQAKAAGKKLIVSEWGSLYNANSESSRIANLNSNIQKINSAKVHIPVTQFVMSKSDLVYGFCVGSLDLLASDHQWRSP